MELLTTWRHRHSQMVLRMLGRKVGTGGSSSHEYLNETAQRHHIFKDFHNISTLLIPQIGIAGTTRKVKAKTWLCLF